MYPGEHVRTGTVWRRRGSLSTRADQIGAGKPQIRNWINIVYTPQSCNLIENHFPTSANWKLRRLVEGGCGCGLTGCGCVPAMQSLHASQSHSRHLGWGGLFSVSCVHATCKRKHETAAGGPLLRIIKTLGMPCRRTVLLLVAVAGRPRKGTGGGTRGVEIRSTRSTSTWRVS